MAVPRDPKGMGGLCHTDSAPTAMKSRVTGLAASWLDNVRQNSFIILAHLALDLAAAPASQAY